MKVIFGLQEVCKFMAYHRGGLCFFALLQGNLLFAQHIPFEKGYWMPEKFVKEWKSNKNHNLQTNQILKAASKPIELIYVGKNEIKVQGYRGKYTIGFRRMNKTSVELTNVMINFAPDGKINSDKSLSKYRSDVRYFLHHHNRNTMYLIVEGKSSLDTITFMQVPKPLINIGG